MNNQRYSWLGRKFNSFNCKGWTVLVSIIIQLGHLGIEVPSKNRSVSKPGLVLSVCIPYTNCIKPKDDSGFTFVRLDVLYPNH